MDVQDQQGLNGQTENNAPESNMENSDIMKEQEKLFEYKMKIKKQLSSGVGWFYWIAGLSIINTVIYLIGSNWSFIVGLGVTQLIDGFAHGASMSGKVIAFILDVVVAGIYVLFGILTKRRHKWAFIVGMILYAVDALIFILVKDWICIAFHVFVLYQIYMGLKAHNLLRKMGI